MVGRWNYPRARLRLKYCTVVSPSFVDAIEKALAQGSEQAQFDALSDVFRQYGHAVPEEVLLGGQMFFSTRREVTGHIEAESVRTAVKAAVSIQTSDGSGGGGGAGFDDGSGSKRRSRSKSIQCGTPVSGSFGADAIARMGTCFPSLRGNRSRSATVRVARQPSFQANVSRGTRTSMVRGLTRSR